MKKTDVSAVSRRKLLQWIALSSVTFPFVSVAQTYPARPVRIILPYSPAGSADMVTRLVAEKLSQSMGQRFIVENKPGASGNIGFELLARAQPDGYTLAVVPDSNLTVNAHIYPNMTFDPIRDTASVSALTTIGVGLVVNEEVPANTVAELIAYSEQTAGGLNFATPGTGTPHHLAGELLKHLTGANLVHVPYKGGAPALQDIVAGHVPVGFVALAIAAPFIESGKLRLLAVTQDQRTSVFPDVSTIGETVPNFDVTSWLGLFAPAGTSDEIVNRLNHEVTAALQEPSVRNLLAAQALDVITGSPAALSERIQKESAQWAALIEARNITVQ